MTPKQKQVFDFLKLHTEEFGYAPTLQEISEHFQYSSTSVAQHFINQLAKKGHLIKDSKFKRNARVANRSEAIDVPLLGLVAAGLPIDAIEIEQNFSVPMPFIKDGYDYFCLKVSGDSMIEEHIQDKDIVLIRRASDCKNGDIVVAIVDGKATLKRFKKFKDRIELQPANPKYKPIVVKPNEDFRLAGILSGLFRF